MAGPSAFQIEVAHMFFSLPASDGFLLAGGGALLASGLTSRPTQDLDFFGEKGRVNVGEMREQFLKEVEVRGWNCEVLQLCMIGLRHAILPTYLCSHNISEKNFCLSEPLK